MAKDITGQPWQFNAAGDFEGLANVGELDASLNGPVFPHRIFVRRIKIVTGSTGGDVLVTESDGGREIARADSAPANDTLEWPINAWVKGIYIDTLPTGANVKVFHGIEGN